MSLKTLPYIIITLGAISAIAAQASELNDPLALPTTQTSTPKAAAAAPMAPAPKPDVPAAPAVDTAPVPPIEKQAPATVQPAVTPPSMSKVSVVETTGPKPTAPTVAERPIMSQTDIPTFRDLDRLRSQNALLAEQVRNSELQAKLLQQKIGAPTVDGPQGQRGVQYLSICGIDNQLSANIVLTNGATTMVREGSVITGLGRVKSISVDGVAVASKSGVIINLEKAAPGTMMGGC